MLHVSVQSAIYSKSTFGYKINSSKTIFYDGPHELDQGSATPGTQGDFPWHAKEFDAPVML